MKTLILICFLSLIMCQDDLKINFLPSNKYKLNKKDLTILKEDLERQISQRVFEIQANWDEREKLRNSAIYRPPVIPPYPIPSPPVNIPLNRNNFAANLNFDNPSYDSNLFDEKRVIDKDLDEKLNNMIEAKIQKDLTTQIALTRQTIKKLQDEIEESKQAKQINVGSTDIVDEKNDKTPLIYFLEKNQNLNSSKSKIKNKAKKNVVNSFKNEYNKNNLKLIKNNQIIAESTNDNLDKADDILFTLENKNDTESFQGSDKLEKSRFKQVNDLSKNDHNLNKEKNKGQLIDFSKINLPDNSLKMKILKDFYLDHKNEVPSYIPKKNTNKFLDSGKNKIIIEMDNGKNMVSENKMNNIMNKNLGINIDKNKDNINNSKSIKMSEDTLNKLEYMENIYNKQERSEKKIGKNNKINQLFSENSETKNEPNIIDKDGPIEIDNISLFD